jgi:hypothetical protein
MIKPQNYDTEQAFTGDFKTITPGGHICKIMRAKEEVTRTGKQQLVIMYDIIEGDCKDYYSDDFKKKFLTNPDAKWQGVHHQLTDGNSLKFFKGMIRAIENSNNGYKFDFDETKLKGKLFGGVFGQEEWLKDGQEIKLSTKLQYIRSVDQVRKGVEVPKIKKLKSTNQTPYDTTSFGTEVFPEEEIPF